MQQKIIFYIFVIITFVGFVVSNELANPTTTQEKDDKLSRLGDIAVKMLSVVADNTEVEISEFAASLLSTLSNAAVVYEAEERSSELYGQMHQIAQTTHNLTNHQENIRNEVDSQMEELRLELNESRSKVAQLEAFIADQVEMLRLELNQTREHMADLEQELAAKPDVVPNDAAFVGFTAWSDTGSVYTSGQTIQFNKVLFNYGSAYDSSTSKFTCPFSGIYSVNVRLEEEDNTEGLIVDAMLGTDTVFTVHVHEDSTYHGASSASAMVGCVTGQTIYIKADGQLDVEDNQGQRCFFSVYLVNQMPDSDVEAGKLL